MGFEAKAGQRRAANGGWGRELRAEGLAEFGVQGLGFREFRVQGLGFRVWEFRVQGLGFRVWGLGLGVWEFRVGSPTLSHQMSISITQKPKIPA